MHKFVQLTTTFIAAVHTDFSLKTYQKLNDNNNNITDNASKQRNNFVIE